MADSQWTMPDDGKNPNSVAVDIINQVQRQFIRHKVDFVIQVGDFTDAGWVGNGIGKTAIDTRALFAQDLYNSGIGFFPLRGNHESSPEAAAEFRRVFPQTQHGLQNASPVDVLSMVNPDALRQPSPSYSGAMFTVGSNFSTPYTALLGLSYAFSHKNASFIMLDNFPVDTNTSFSIRDQQPWITRLLTTRGADNHAFVFTHMDFDNMFSVNDSEGRNNFIRSMAQSNARFLVNGHVHMHNHSVLYSSDLAWSIHQLVCAPSSSKFYLPAPPTDPPSIDYLRRPIGQELKTIGYYIFTVSGSNVTIDYYSADVNAIYSSGAYQISSVPDLNFIKRETFGYSLRGKETLVPPGRTYTSIKDVYSSRVGALPTSVGINGGSNGRYAVNGSGIPLNKAVNTGWSPMLADTSSDIVMLWGIETMGDLQPDIYTLSISYYPSRIDPAAIRSGALKIAIRDGDGNWVNAVSKNRGGISSFVYGPYDSSYGLGTYGVDVSNNTAWAVVNNSGEFAVVQSH